MYLNEMSKKHKLFFDFLEFEFDFKKNDTDIIGVFHILPDFLIFSEAINKIANLKLVIPKPNSINKDILSKVEDKYNIRTDINRNNIEEIIKEIDPKRKTIFLDIGAYFSEIKDELKSILGENFLGIIEDTENGHQKYLKKELDFNFYSVARSPLKYNEDYLVGSAITFSIEAILRKKGIILKNKKAGIIGGGKIGKSILHNLLKKGSIVSFFDFNTLISSNLISEGFNFEEKEYLLKNSDIVCLATGNKSLRKNDFSLIKKGAYVFLATSSDDELDLEYLNNNYEKEDLGDYFIKYSNKKNKHYFYLINDGNTVNFVHGTTVGDFILFVHAEIILAIFELINNFYKRRENYLISQKKRELISKIWIEIFVKNKKDNLNNELYLDLIKTLKAYDKNDREKKLLEIVKVVPNIISRKNFFGHFTASALIFNNKKQLLLVFHKKLKMFLQPGGHLEKNDKSLYLAAKREAEEETGLKVEENKKYLSKAILLDIHKIPSSFEKMENEHYHFDFMFVFDVKNEKVILQKEEVSDYRWVDLDYDFKDSAIKKAINLIKSESL